MKEYNYTNKLGIHKKLIVEKEDGGMHIYIWNMDNGEFCGSTLITQEELNYFLQEYDIKG